MASELILRYLRIYFFFFGGKLKLAVPAAKDRGPEYRSIIGLPGGVSHPSFIAFQVQLVKTSRAFYHYESSFKQPVDIM
jgi:predicted SAM-dependent methyltransferase